MSSRRELEARLITRAAADEAFRRELLHDPRAAVERELGARLPEGVSLVIHEETPDTMHLVLPARPAAGASAAGMAIALRAGPWGR